MHRKLKYETLAELRAAFKSGELDREQDRLVVDNDSAHVYVEDEQGRDVKVYQGGTPEELLDEALDLLRIPHRGA
jgi:hypothetical protein